MSYPRRRRPQQSQTPAVRVAPSDVAIEQEFIAALLLDNGIIPQAAPQISPEAFYAPKTAEAFKIILQLWQNGDVIDFVTVPSKLPNLAMAELVGWGESCFPSQWQSYVNRIKELARARQLLQITRSAEDGIFQKATPLDDVVASLVNDLIALQSGTAPGGFEPVVNALLSAQKAIEQAVLGKSGIPIGFRDFDARVGGLQRGELVIAAGRPGMGKTAFADCVAVNVAHAGFGVGYASLEMTAAQIGTRLLSAHTRIENRNLRRGNLADRDYPRIVAAAGELGQLPLSILDSDRSWPRLKQKIHSLKLQQPDVALIIIDYIGLLDAETDTERYLELGKITAEAKELAKRLDVAIIICSQLNRAVENRPDKRPQLADLRESGNIEQDADIVLLLHRPRYYDPDFQPADLANLYVEKNRNGDTGLVKLRFDAKTVSFSDWSEPPSPRDITQAKGASA